MATNMDDHTDGVSPGSGAAVFSTNFGTRPKRRTPSRPHSGAIARGGNAESSRAGVAQAAQYWRSKFPEDCMRLWPGNGWRIDDLWDDHDIQIETPNFLHLVLTFLINENATMARVFAHEWYAQSPHRFLILVDHTRNLYDPSDPLALVYEVFDQSELGKYPAEFLWHVANNMRAALISVGTQYSQEAAPLSLANPQDMYASAMNMQGSTTPFVISSGLTKKKKKEKKRTAAAEADSKPEIAVDSKPKAVAAIGTEAALGSEPKTVKDDKQKAVAETMKDVAVQVESEVKPESTSESGAQIKPETVPASSSNLTLPNAQEAAVEIKPVAGESIPEAATEAKPESTVGRELHPPSMPASRQRQSPTSIPSVPSGSQILQHPHMPPSVQPPYIPPAQIMPYQGYGEFHPAHPPMGYPPGTFGVPGSNMPSPNTIPINPRGPRNGGRQPSGPYNQPPQPRVGWAENLRNPMTGSAQSSPQYHPANPVMGLAPNAMNQGPVYNPNTGMFPPPGMVFPPNQMHFLPGMRFGGPQMAFNPPVVGPHQEPLSGSAGPRGAQFNDMTNMAVQPPMNTGHMPGQQIEQRGGMNRRPSRGDRPQGLFDPYHGSSNPKYANFAKVNPLPSNRKNSRGSLSNQYGRDRRQSSGAQSQPNFNGGGDTGHYGSCQMAEAQSLPPAAPRKYAVSIDPTITNDPSRGCSEHFIGLENDFVDTLYVPTVDTSKSTKVFQQWIETASGADVVHVAFNTKATGAPYCFVRFKDTDGARKGLGLNGQTFFGKSMIFKVSRQYYMMDANRPSPYYASSTGNKNEVHGLPTPHGHRKEGTDSGPDRMGPVYSPQDARSSLQVHRPHTEEDAATRGSPEAKKSQGQKTKLDAEPPVEMRTITSGFQMDKSKQSEEVRPPTAGSSPIKAKPPAVRDVTEHDATQLRPRGPSDDKGQKPVPHIADADLAKSTTEDYKMKVEEGKKEVMGIKEAAGAKGKEKDAADEKKKKTDVTEGANDIKDDLKTAKESGKKEARKATKEFREGTKKAGKEVLKADAKPAAKGSQSGEQKPKTTSKVTDISKAVKAKATEPKGQRHGAATTTPKDASTIRGPEATSKATVSSSQDTPGSTTAAAKAGPRNTKGKQAAKKERPVSQPEPVKKEVVEDQQPISSGPSAMASGESKAIKPAMPPADLKPVRASLLASSIAATPSPSRDIKASTPAEEVVKTEQPSPAKAEPTPVAKTTPRQEAIADLVQENATEETSSDDDQKADSSFHSAKESLSDTDKQEAPEANAAPAVGTAETHLKIVSEKVDKVSVETPLEGSTASPQPKAGERAVQPAAGVEKKSGAKQTESLNPFAAQKALAKKEKFAAKKAKKKAKTGKKVESDAKSEGSTRPEPAKATDGNTEAQGDGKAENLQMEEGDQKAGQEENPLPGQKTATGQQFTSANMAPDAGKDLPAQSNDKTSAELDTAEEAHPGSSVLNTLIQEAAKPVLSNENTSPALDIDENSLALDLGGPSITPQGSKKVKNSIKVAVPNADLLARKSSSKASASTPSSPSTTLVTDDLKGNGNVTQESPSNDGGPEADVTSDAGSDKTAVPDGNFYTPLQTPNAFGLQDSPNSPEPATTSSSPTTETKPGADGKKKKRNKPKKKKVVTVISPEDDVRPDVGPSAQSPAADSKSTATLVGDDKAIEPQTANAHTFSDQIAHVDNLTGRRKSSMSYYESRNAMNPSQLPYEKMTITEQIDDYVKEKALMNPILQQVLKNPAQEIEHPPVTLNQLEQIINRGPKRSWIYDLLENDDGSVPPAGTVPFFREKAE